MAFADDILIRYKQEGTTALLKSNQGVIKSLGQLQKQAKVSAGGFADFSAGFDAIGKQNKWFSGTMDQVGAAVAAASTQLGVYGLIAAAAVSTVQKIWESNPIATWTKFTDTIKASGQELINWGKNAQWLGRQLTYNVTLPIIGLGTAAVAAFGQMEDHLMRAAAAFGVAANRSNAEFRKIQDAVINMAKHSIVPLAGISDAMYELASAGYDVDKSISALPHVIRLVEVAAVEAGDAVNYAVRQEQLWGDQGYDLQKILDITAVAVQKSTAHFEDFTHNVEMSAQFAKQANLNYEQLCGAIAVLSDRGAVLGRIGFNVSQMFSQMVAPSDKAKGVLDEVGVSFYHMVDGMNKAKPMTQFLEELGNAIRTKWPKDFEKQAQALNDIFNIRAGRAALTLIDPKGLEDLKEFEKLLTSGDIQGALKKLDELMAQDPWYRFKVAINSINASFAELGQKIAEILAPYVEKLADKISIVVQWFNNLNDGTKKAIGIFLLVIAAVGPVLVVFASMAEIFGLLVSSIGAILSPFGLLLTLIGVTAIAAVAGFAIAYVEKFGSVQSAVENLKNAVMIWWENMKAAWNDPIVQQAIQNVKQALENVGTAVGNVINALLGGGGQGGKPLSDLFSDNKTTAEKMAGIINTLAGWLNYLANVVIPAIPPAVDKMKDAWERIKPILSWVYDKLIGVGEKILWVIDNFSKLKTELKILMPGIPIGTALQKWLQGIAGPIMENRGGLIGYQGGGMVPGASATMRDRVPAMLTPGEGVMSRKAIENFLKTGGGTGGQAPVYNIEIKPGMMIATPGEIRYFTRQLRKLIQEDELRSASPGIAFRGTRTANM